MGKMIKNRYKTILAILVGFFNTGTVQAQEDENSQSGSAAGDAAQRRYEKAEEAMPIGRTTRCEWVALH